MTITRVTDTVLNYVDSIAALRTFEPVRDGEWVTVDSHTSGTGLGGGRFRSRVVSTGYTDNNGTVIVTTGGNVWLRENVGYIAPTMFGATPRVDDLTPSAHVAIIAAVAAAISSNAVFTGLGETYNLTAGVYINNTNAIVFENIHFIITNSVMSDPVIRVRNADHLVRKVRIDGRSTPMVIGINVESTASGTVVEACKIVNTGRTAIYSTASRVVARNNITDSCGLLGTGNYRSSIWFNENEHAVMEGNICTHCAWGIIMRNQIGTSQGYFNTMRNNIVVSATGTDPDCQGISASAQFHLSTIGNIVRGFPNNAIDHQNCFGLIISDNQLHQCSDGVFIGDRSCGRILITNNNIEGCQTGVRYYNPVNSVPEYQNQTFADVIISDNVIYTSVGTAIWVTMSGTTSANYCTTVTNNIIDGNGSTGKGIIIDTVLVGMCSDNQVRRVREHGINLTSCDGLRVEGNNFVDCGFSTTGTYDGIRATSCQRMTFLNNYAVGGSMVYAVNMQSCNQSMIDYITARSTTGATAHLVTGGTGNIVGTNMIKG